MSIPVGTTVLKCTDMASLDNHLRKQLGLPESQTVFLWVFYCSSKMQKCNLSGVILSSYWIKKQYFILKHFGGLCSNWSICILCTYLLFKKFKTLLIKNIHKLWLEILITVPSASCYSAIWLQVIKHVNFFFSCLKSIVREQCFKCCTMNNVCKYIGQSFTVLWPVKCNTVAVKYITHCYRFNCLDEFFAF